MDTAASKPPAIRFVKMRLQSRDQDAHKAKLLALRDFLGR
jgi:hypothetical protein